MKIFKNGKIRTLLIASATFAIGLGFNNFAMSGIAANYKVAVVNVSQVIDSSAQVRALKKEQQAKMLELQSWLITAKSDIEKQSTKESKEKLVKKYDADFAKKQEVIQKNYTTKLQAIDKNITGIISTEAKEKGYDLVLTKTSVLYGGEDITSAIAKKVK